MQNIVSNNFKNLLKSSQVVNESWGVRPVLFEIHGYKVQSYPTMMFIAILVGLIIYFYQLKKDNIKNSNSIFIAIFAITFSAIGAKIPILFMNWSEIQNNVNGADILSSGRTIVGGLIGGAIGTLFAKKIFKIKERMGNQLAIPIAVGMGIGHIGCILRGCCYGIQTNLPWGIDFGDNILRQPTQIYEMVFDFLLAIYMIFRKKKGVEPDELFTLFLNSYLSFRFFIEFIRVEKVSFIGLTDFQILCIVGLLYTNRKKIFKLFKDRRQTQNGQL